MKCTAFLIIDPLECNVVESSQFVLLMFVKIGLKNDE